MFCGATCIIAFIFLVANIFTILSCQNIDKREFNSVLNTSQKSTYKTIIEERRNIYYMGFVLGIILSILVIAYMKKIQIQGPDLDQSIKHLSKLHSKSIPEQTLHVD